ncbi:hypothetical protein [Kitasatospora sp. MAP5-34]|uniref:hypothetical protein n=1 Tax=Kitasatospora sp. MAP5-34 TaxID=3035102 RepID=UPI0024769EDB|nr:hypothetical protein [Kitasatospora sp. MAP5-34]MDH6580727.1 hypothetical protein [Kitasatospora sp. MAP5-34]
MPTRPDLPPVTVVLDPHDDLPHTRTAQAAHDPATGRATVHPTIGTDSTVCLAYDILAALGKPVPVTGYSRLDPVPPWAIAAAWILATPITHLTVLRAHLLTSRRLDDLLTLRERTGVHLALVCHRRRPTPTLERTLAATNHRLADAAAHLPGTDPTNSPHPRPGPRRGPLQDRWLNLSALTTLCAIDGPQRRCRCTPPLAHDRGFHPPQMPPTTAAEAAFRLHTTTAHPHLAAALATALFTAASDTQLSTAHPTDLADGAATITLHDPDGLRYGCMTHPVPPWARPLLIAATHQHAIATGADTPLFDTPFATTGMPHLTNLAETCKLRPPQPPRNRPRPGRPGPAPSLSRTIWPLSNAHYRFPWAVMEDMRGCPPPSPRRR